MTPEVKEIFDLVEESDRRCTEVRVAIIRREIPVNEIGRSYARATAPLASAARRIEQLTNGDFHE